MSAAPPYWQVDVQKRLGTEYWTNVYHCARPDQAAAKAFADGVVAFERIIHQSIVQFISYRVAAYPGPSEGTIQPIGSFGTAGSTTYLPLFNVLRVDFPVDLGRPSRKFYRLPLGENAQIDGVIEPTLVDAYQIHVNNYFSGPASVGMVDVDGQLITQGRVMPPVGMRQLRRGSRRRITPVIPVA